MTPMAANFNLVPAALLELKDQYGVIRAQVATALPAPRQHPADLLAGVPMTLDAISPSSRGSRWAMSRPIPTRWTMCCKATRTRDRRATSIRSSTAVRLAQLRPWLVDAADPLRRLFPGIPKAQAIAELADGVSRRQGRGGAGLSTARRRPGSSGPMGGAGCFTSPRSVAARGSPVGGGWSRWPAPLRGGCTSISAS